MDWTETRETTTKADHRREISLMTPRYERSRFRAAAPALAHPRLDRSLQNLFQPSYI